jgi:hypothetical protein
MANESESSFKRRDDQQAKDADKPEPKGTWFGSNVWSLIAT